MGLLERGRRKLGGGRGGDSAGTKDLYDAFGDGPSDESDLEDDGRLTEATGLRYHDDFLEDDGEGEGNDTRRSSRDNRAPVYDVDDDDDQPEREALGTGGSGSGSGQQQIGSNSGSSGSWQDAAEDART
jgi:kexin